MKKSVKKAIFSKAQKLTLSLFKGVLAVAFILCLLMPFIISFGGAYNNPIEYISLLGYVCIYVMGVAVGIGAIPFIVVTLIGKAIC